ncbi:unnamed protein product [Cuscuta europaea]|uniref:Uncharacterized protein n=1 Tax=Cuscuta europaea TaxID=41803 RepID=A0A9P0YMY8_CUSEU|nr:unnamed protein product [Cuscuta europaea]
MSGEQTVRHAVVGKRDRHENHHRHHGMHEVREPNLVPVVLGDFHSGVALEHRQPPRRHKAVVHFPAVWPPEAVGEVEEEAGEGTEGQEDEDHGGADGGALPFGVDAGEDHLEG